ncbi:DNA-directed RNA polymerase III subunit RPC7 [Denticeps clupeoides]|uniref:DNA-directed RNA polymerase III subunit RPC7 n=1 Tax=Denticeps clupeoides TaxID=299321 RepID=UPI0010A51A76|nr:DNA-directed RNA polymerase III subunit RPC7-like [Denticeps clupeoides]
MAGKGRGVSAFTFSVEALGITRGNMPETRRGPGPQFPQLENKPLPLKLGEDEDYMLALKQNMGVTMSRLPSYIKPRSARPDVERYKQKYLKECLRMEQEAWTPDWQRLPKELMPSKKTAKKKSAVKTKAKKLTSKENEDLMSKLSELEKKGDDKSDEEAEGKKAKGEEEEGEEEEIEGVEYEEENEEDNDYIASYFEDGDDYLAGSDDNMDEATY